MKKNIFLKILSTSPTLRLLNVLVDAVKNTFRYECHKPWTVIAFEEHPKGSNPSQTAFAPANCESTGCSTQGTCTSSLNLISKRHMGVLNKKFIRKIDFSFYNFFMLLKAN